MRKINKEVATLIQERLDIGAKKYGRDIPINDKRDFLQESIEEALDNAIYLACYLIQIKQGVNNGGNIKGATNRDKTRNT